MRYKYSEGTQSHRYLALGSASYKIVGLEGKYNWAMRNKYWRLAREGSQGFFAASVAVVAKTKLDGSDQ